MKEYTIRRIAAISSEFPSKFGIPRQSGLADTKAEIIFEPEYASPEAVRGLEKFNYLWLIWQFSENTDSGWHATVRPPRLGGNTRVGVFATRSPFRPNALGLSSVKLESIEEREGIGPVLHVSGADLMDNTPIYDIKPYVAYADIRTGARCGFASVPDRKLTVRCPENLLAKLPAEEQQALLGVLAQDPRPHYQSAPDRIYGMDFGAYTVKFRVEGNEVFVLAVEKRQDTLMRTEE